MEIRGSRLVFVGAGVAALALCIGTVFAKPGVFGKGSKSIDPAVAKRIKPMAVTQDQLFDPKKLAPEPAVPMFQAKRLGLAERALLLGAADPQAVPGPLRFDARTDYHDDDTYMETLAYSGGSVGVRPLRNYFHFMGSPEVMATPYLRPALLIHYRAQPNTRYLLECAIDASGPTNFFAADGRSQYSVSAADNATLLYLRDQGPTLENVVVQISADATGWYLDGCELTNLSR